MTTFGETLRSFRQASNDPDRLNKRLTQERLGELMGHEMGDRGFTGAAISDWERGESKINAQDRNVLVALIQILHRCGGLRGLEEANQFFETGNYRPLDTSEVQKIFGEILHDADIEKSIPETVIPKSSISFLIENLFTISDREMQELVREAQIGPPPPWPRMLAALMRRVTDRFSISITTIAWAGVWIIALWLIGPSLRWPFANRTSALLAIGMYVCGTLVIPLFVGLLTDTKNN